MLRISAFFGLALGLLVGCGGDDAAYSGAPAGDGGAGGSSGGGVGGLGTTAGSSGVGAAGGTGGLSGGAGGSSGAGGASCGNNALEGNEECDDGNLNPADGCETDCRFSCVPGDPSRDDCDDGNPCNGSETCSTAHACVSGTALAEGADCGGGSVCVNGVCAPVGCGDRQVQGSEECDDGNVESADGCENDCTHSCVSTDPSRDCSLADECQGISTCDDATHRCSAPTPLADATPCSNGTGYCLSGVCTLPECGNGRPEPGEDCDDANFDDTDGCTAACRFSCADTAACDDGDPCNGSESCVDITGGKRCERGTPADQGVACGASLRICDGAGSCVDSICGDRFVDTLAGEVCDDADSDNTNGCTDTCQYTCTTGAQCDDNNLCTQNHCEPATHTCANPADSAQDGNVCSVGGGVGLCDTGVCLPANCGDSTVDAPIEQCDLGAQNGIPGSGCASDCQFQCTGDSACDDTNPCNGAETCATVSGGQSCQPGTALVPGSACGTGRICDTALACVVSICGDGLIDATLGEDCDNGPGGNGPGTGCTSACRFECNTNPDCDDGNLCNGSETCQPLATGRTCLAGVDASLGVACGTGRICNGSGTCALSRCGDGWVAAPGEECEPPGAGSCDSNCQTIVPAACGDGRIDGAEQCDDGNTANQDGCDSACNYELMFRLGTAVIRRGAAPSWCSGNALGSALSSTALNQINTSLQDGIDSGQTNMVLQAIALDDLSGVSDTSFELGFANAASDPARGAWTLGSNPLDWWYLLDANSVDSVGLATGRLPSALSARQITTTPATIVLNLLLQGSTAQMELVGANIRARTGTTTSVPTALPTGGLAPGLTVVEDVLGDQSGEGLCGGITVESLSRVPVAEALATGSTACDPTCSASESYTYCGANQPVSASCNSLLDVLVGGCQVRFLGFCVNAITPTNPDVDNGGVSPLSLGANNKVPTSQVNGNRNAYSMYMTFAGRRGHATGIQ